MDIRVKRNRRTDKATIGSLSVDGVYMCDTLEDVDRGLKSTDSLADISKVKVRGETAIPSGRYAVTLKLRSPRFYSKAYYKRFCDGYLPRLLDVKGFSGVLVHRGSNESHTDGCILVGKASGNILVDSQRCFESLYMKLKEASDRGEAITITIE